MFTTLQQALSWIEQYDNLRYQHTPHKLKRIQTVLTLCNNPHKDLNIVHIAGSKGKSSTAIALSHLLCKNNYSTGLFSSPHIMHYNERIKINGKNIDTPYFLWAINHLYTLIETYNKKQAETTALAPTMFEKLFAISLLIFQQKKVQWAIIEVGIGGLFDTTNVIQPKLSIISTIEYEHRAILGNTLEEIAAQKAGIIKKNTPVLIGKQVYKQVHTVFSTVALEHNAPCYFFADITKYTIRSYSDTVGNVSNSNTTHIAMETMLNGILSSYTVHTPSILKPIIENQLLAFCAFQILHTHAQLHSTPYKHSSSTVQFSHEVQIPCRAEIISGIPPLYIDIAHTAQSLLASLGMATLRFTPLVLIMGLSKDKDPVAIVNTIATLLPLFEKIIITTAGTRKPMPAKKLYLACKQTQPTLQSLQCITDYHRAFQKGLTIAHKKNAMIVIAGSTYLCAELRKQYVQQQKEYNNVS